MNALQAAQETLNEILQLTLNLHFTGQKEQEEAEVDAYVAHIEAREPLVKKLTELKPQIDTQSPEFPLLQQMITDIASLDKKHSESMAHLRDAVSSSLKEVKSGQKLNTAYHIFDGNEVGSIDYSK
jgi:uncharacterized protein YfbU (UPF0304 family)